MRIYAQIKPAVKTVKDLDSDYQHIVDTQDMDSLLDHLGQVVIDENYGSFFVKVEDGDYTSVYACDYQYPHENDRVYEIVMIHEESPMNEYVIDISGEGGYVPVFVHITADSISVISDDTIMVNGTKIMLDSEGIHTIKLNDVIVWSYGQGQARL